MTEPRTRTLIAALVAAVLLLLVAVPSAFATEAVSGFDVGLSNYEAGGHPNIRTEFSLADPAGPEVPREVEVRMPEGIFGNPGAVIKCPTGKFALNECEPGSQVGVVTIRAARGGNPEFLMGTAPIYNLKPGAVNETALLGFVVPTANIPIQIPVEVRTGSDYGLNFNVSGISQQVPIASVSFEIWGSPAAAEHDVERFPAGNPGNPSSCPGLLTTACIKAPYPEAGEPLTPYVDAPSTCTGAPLPVHLLVHTYQDPNDASTAEGAIEPITNCERQRFDPSLKTALTSQEADSPSGLDISVGSVQFLSSAPTPSSVKSASVILPEGFSINPDAADGQSACSDAQAGFGTEAPSSCPDNSKVGTVEVITPALEGPLVGSLYIGEPLPGDQYRVFMIFEGFGLFAKIAAEFHPDPLTGQLTMSLPSLPQVPFESFNLHLFASDRGLIATADNCAVYSDQATLQPWNPTLAPQVARGVLSITSGPNGSACPGVLRPFVPRLAAGTSNPVAGAFSDFHLKLDRDDGDQFLGDLDFTMPPGLTASLRGLSYCPESAILAAAANSGRAEQANPSCPASSQIGTTNVEAGPGDHPFNAVGKMYMSGPFKGAPLSLAAITPALAGPYDYGVVVVRVAVNVDPTDAHVIAASDRVPSIIGGIPIRLRSIQVNLERPHFMINPTNCDPFSVVSHGIGDEGTSVAFSSPFQVINCKTLPFKPHMTITQRGGSARAKDPVVEFDLRTREGDANLRSAAVTLPKAFAVDQRHLSNLCSKAELASKRCAGKAAIGTVSVQTPLLEGPLTGLAYAVSGYGKLPHLAFVLQGQVTVIPQAKTTSVEGGHLKTVVPIIPDVPIGHFHLALYGGAKGYLTNTKSLCSGPIVTKIEYTGQNGSARTERVAAKTKCPAKKKKT